MPRWLKDLFGIPEPPGKAVRCLDCRFFAYNGHVCAVKKPIKERNSFNPVYGFEEEYCNPYVENKHGRCRYYERK